MKVFWNGEELKIRQTNVFPSPYLENKICSYVIFRIREEGWLELEGNLDDEVVIRPKSAGLCAVRKGERTSIRLTKSCSFSVEPEGDRERAFLVFAVAEDTVCKQEYENLIVFKAGDQIVSDIVVEKDHTLIYLEDGAYVGGMIRAEGRKHIAVSGSGVLNHDYYASRSNMILLKDCTDVVLENITLTDNWNWNVKLDNCENVLINGIHIVGCRGNSDGIDICGSRNVTVRNCFTRVWDDSFVVKAFGTELADILVENCVCWNDFARPIEVGVELQADEVKNVCFRNIDVIHSTTGYPIMGIHHGDHATVSNIRFEDIRIEDAPGAQLFDVRISHSVWNADDPSLTGDIRDLYFERIRLVDRQPVSMSPSRLEGLHEGAGIRNVTISGIDLCGYTASNAEQLGLEIKGQVENVQIIPGDLPLLSRVETTLELTEKAWSLEDGGYRCKVKAGFRNTASTEIQLPVQLVISPSRKTVYEDQELTVSLEAGQSFETEFALILPPGNHCIHLESPEPQMTASWLVTDNPLPLGADVYSAPKLKFVDCRGVCSGEVQLALVDNCLAVRSECLKDRELTVYAAPDFEILDGQVIFSVEETDSGLAPAVTNGKKGYELAPQLRCPAEITYVFWNEPKVEIRKESVCDRISGIAWFNLQELGIAEPEKGFRLELTVENDAPHRYPFSLFGSQTPEQTCHMFVRAVKENGK